MIITVFLLEDGTVKFYIHKNLNSQNGFPIEEWTHRYNSLDEAIDDVSLVFRDKELLEKNLETTLNGCAFSTGYIPKNIIRKSNAIRRREKKNWEKSAKQTREYYLKLKIFNLSHLNVLMNIDQDRIKVKVTQLQELR